MLAIYGQNVDKMVSEINHKHVYSTLTAFHSEFVWKGESEIASITSTAGFYNGTFNLHNLFDNDSNSFWRRNNDYNQYDHIAELIIEFQMPINFLSLILQKRQGSRNYKRICLRISYLFRM